MNRSVLTLPAFERQQNSSADALVLADINVLITITGEYFKQGIDA